MGTTVWSRYARVGKDCKSTLGFFDGVSMPSFSLVIIFWKKLIWYALGRSISNEGSYKKFNMIKLSVCMLHKYLNIVGDSMFLKGIFRLLVQVLNVWLTSLWLIWIRRCAYDTLILLWNRLKYYILCFFLLLINFDQNQFWSSGLTHSVENTVPHDFPDVSGTKNPFISLVPLSRSNYSLFKL